MVNDNLPVRPLLPDLITFTDDSILFVFKRTAHNSDRWYLEKKTDTTKQGGEQAIYSNEIGGTDNLNGLRVRLNVTINALVLMATPFISVTGISRENYR